VKTIRDTNVSPLGYRPWLDGLRAIAILAVFIQHIQHFLYDRQPVLLQFGILGVDIFFVLSGFLITSLLLEEYQSTNSISLTKFYARRGLRLLPALFFFLISMNLYSSLFPHPHEGTSNARLTVGAIFYVTNWLFAFGADSDLFGHLWSLAIEEQFYLVWPLLLTLMLRSRLPRRILAAATLLVIALVCFHRISLIWSGVSLERIYFGSDTRFDSLLTGCLAAMIVSWQIIPKGQIIALTLKASSGISVIVVSAYLLDLLGIPGNSIYKLGFTIFAMAVALFILSVMRMHESMYARVLEWPALVWVGKISYSLYLWHVFAITLTLRLHAPNAIRALLSLPLAIGLAAFSYYVAERPFLKLKSRFHVRQGGKSSSSSELLGRTQAQTVV